MFSFQLSSKVKASAMSDDVARANSRLDEVAGHWNSIQVCQTERLTFY
jgi:hypothetical protein